MKFIDYINNPGGNKSSVISNREMYKSMYKSKYDKLLLRETGKIDYKLYYINDIYYCHIKIPSEVVEKFYYDVIIELYSSTPSASVLPSLDNYDCRFWSNDPSFVFTFANTFMKHDLLIRDFDSKMSKLALKQDAVEKNPDNQVWYVKSLFFAYLTMKRYRLFTKSNYMIYGNKYSKSVILKEIEPADKKIDSRQMKEKEQKKIKAKAIDTANKNRPNVSKTTSNITTTSIVKKSKSSKNMSTTKRTKRI